MNPMQQLETALALPNFYHWLRSRPASSAIGEAGQNCYCPIALYLCDIFQDCITWVDNESIELRNPGDHELLTEIYTPTWVQGFIAKVDGLGVGTQITAGEACDRVWETIRDLGMKHWGEDEWEVFRDRVFSKSSQYRKQKQWASCQALQNAGRRSIELQTYLGEGDVFFFHNTISYNVGVQAKNQS